MKLKGNTVTNLRERLMAMDGVRVDIDDDGSFVVVRPINSFLYLSERERLALKWRVDHGLAIDAAMPQSADVETMIASLPEAVLVDWGGPVFEGFPSRLDDGKFHRANADRILASRAVFDVVLAAAKQVGGETEKVEESAGKNSPEPSPGA